MTNNNPLKVSKASLLSSGIHIDTLSKNKDGNYIARRAFYYTRGKTSKMLADQFSKLSYIEVIDHGEVWKPFRGSASIANSSHWYVIFKLKQ